MAFFRDEDEASRLPPLRHVASQAVEEGYRLVAPDGTLTPVVEQVQWMDNHPSGPDTHVMVSFEDGTNVEFPFDVPLTMLWYAEPRPVSADEIAATAPVRWGLPAAPWM